MTARKFSRAPIFRHSGGLLAAPVLALVLASCSSPAPVPRALAPLPRTPPTGAQAPLLPFFQALDALADPHAAPVTVLQIGDSHTANDSFASAMRDQLQARFGNAGRGYLQAGIPFKWYRPEAVHVEAQGFITVSSFKTASPPFGIGAVRQHADGVAQATLATTDGASIGAAEVELLTQPGGGSVVVSAAGAPPARVSTNAAPGPLWLNVPVAAGSSSITLQTAGDGPVDWLGWSIARGGPGIFYSNLGTPGATVDIMDQWDPTLMRAELAHLHPAMILLAFGTNEAFKDSLDPAGYQQRYIGHLAFLHQAAPYATIIAVAPPDGQRKRGRTRPQDLACNAQWAIPPHLAEVRALQRTAAQGENAFYWDWSAAMGGPCSMSNWVQAVPQLGAPDHVHMRTAGYAITAQALFATLMRAYDQYRGAAGHP